MNLSPEALLYLPVLLFSIICHEVGHAWAAFRGGDDTARLQGRITLNPAAHIDPIGTVAIPLLMMLTSVPLIGWARPVPVQRRKLRSRQWDLAVSLAGVGCNLALALLAALLLKVFVMTGFLDKAFMADSLNAPLATLFILRGFVHINFMLMLFNLIPIPPLDGSHVLFHFVKTRDSALFPVMEFLERFGFIILLLLVFSGTLRSLLWPVWDVLTTALMFVFQLPPQAL